MPQAVSKPQTVDYLYMSSAADLGTALDVALTISYRSTLTAEMQGGTPLWSLELNGPGNPTPVTATIGDVLVWHADSQFLEAMPEAKFEQLYTP